FKAAMKSVNAVAEAAEAANHHPDITINYNKVRFTLVSHDAGGGKQKDVKMAGKNKQNFGKKGFRFLIYDLPIENRKSKIVNQNTSRFQGRCHFIQYFLQPVELMLGGLIPFDKPAGGLGEALHAPADRLESLVGQGQNCQASHSKDS